MPIYNPGSDFRPGSGYGPRKSPTPGAHATIAVKIFPLSRARQSQPPLTVPSMADMLRVIFMDMETRSS